MELTNQTYLRSRVDMQLADSLRMKASNKISAGVLGNARENSGGFSAGIRFKSNQYLLQSRRANIQNSLSYLDVQRDAIMEARDIMERIALTKIKFDSPTLNQTDRNNLNLEFSELTEELISLRDKKFNGVSLFTPTSTSSSDLFGSARTSLETGSGSNNGVGISQHVIDYQDVRNIYDAGEAVRRGKGGLNVINFEADPVQRQVERISLDKINAGDSTPTIAAGDVFRLSLNELSSIREVESTHSIVYQATAADEALTDVNGDGSVFDPTKTHEAVRDQLIILINDAAANGVNGQFVTATADGSSGILITSEGEGDPFELWNVSSSNNAVSFVKEATPTRTNVANDAEVSTLQLDLRDDNRNTGMSIKAGDSISVQIKDEDGALQNFTYTIGANELTNPPAWWGGAAFSADAGTDPENEWAQASLFMFSGLADKIEAEKAAKNVLVDATIAPSGWTVGGLNVGAQLTLRSTDRGTPLDAVFDASKVNITPTTPPAQNESASTISITLNREIKAGDTVTISGTGDAQYEGGIFKNFSHGGTITSNAALAAAIQADADFTSANYDAGTGVLTVTAATNLTDDQPNLSISQTQTLPEGAVLGTNLVYDNSLAGQEFPLAQATFTNRVSQARLDNAASWNDGSSGTGLRLDVNNITTAGGHGTTTVTTGQGGSGYGVGDLVRVRGSQLGGFNGTNDFQYTVGSLTTASQEVAALGYADAGVALQDGNYNNVQVTGGTGNSLQVDLQITGGNTITITNFDNKGTGTGYVDGETVNIALSDIDSGVGATFSKHASSTDPLIAGTYNGVTTTTKGVDLDITIDASGNINIDAVNGGGALVQQNEQLTILGGQLGGTNGSNDLVLNVDTLTNDNINLTIDRIEGAVATVTNTGGLARTSWSFSNQSTSGGNGTGLEMSVTIDRAGLVTANSINTSNRGQDYQVGDIIEVNLPASYNGDGPKFQLTAAQLEEDFSNAKDAAVTGTRGNQYNPATSNIAASTDVPTANVVGDAKIVKAQFAGDNGTSGGMIAPGDQFRVRITEVLHSDESTPTFPDTAVKTALSTPALTDANVISVTAQAGEDTDTVGANLVTAINNYIQGNFTAAEQEHLPTASYEAATSSVVFTASKPGEDFDITVDFSSSADLMTGTGVSDYTTNPNGMGDPVGNRSETKNISPFSVTKSISYFEEMLAQNEAETSRLMKAMEHLENSMVHNEDALGKVQDTDYSQAAVEQMRNSVKVQMANNVIGKSMRMNDLLIDLTTKHHRGAMLNAKA